MAGPAIWWPDGLKTLMPAPAGETGSVGRGRRRSGAAALQRWRCRRSRGAVIGSGVGGSLGPYGHCRHLDRSGRAQARDSKHESRGDQAEKARAHECQLVVAENRPDRARREGNRSSAELVGGEDPPVYDREILLSEDLARELDRRWHGGDPIEPVEDDEQDQAEVGATEDVREQQERQAAQAVIEE